MNLCGSRPLHVMVDLEAIRVIFRRAAVQYSTTYSPSTLQRQPWNQIYSLNVYICGIFPFQSLSFNVLWRIFDINADIFNDASALKTTLATSYVCRDWRSFLLSSTSIWAHVMDLDHSVWRKVEGSREMIRRSGTAFLWMKVHSPFGYRRDGKHILDIIDTNWDRIQKFEATIQVDFVDQWTLLYRPAPCLQSLSLSFDCQSPKFDNLLPSLFGGSAPMLRYFRLKSNRLNITAMSWLCQVRSMELGIKLTISETLGVLASTMNLTSLHLDDVAADSSVVALSPVSLPKLARLDLNLSGTLSPGAALLEHMFIPLSCKVIISAKGIQRCEIDKKSNFKPIIEAISTCAQRSFAHNSPQSVYVAITPCSFTFESAYQSHKPNFAFHLNLARAHTFPGHALTMLLREFSLPGLAKVTWFGFKITAVQRQVPGLAAFIHHQLGLISGRAAVKAYL